MPLVIRCPSGESAPVYALHLDGDSRPAGHRYSLCPELRAASRLDIYCGQAALAAGAGERCILMDGAEELPATVLAVYDLRDHALLCYHPIQVATNKG